MGFFDEYKDEGGAAAYLSREERDILIEAGADLAVLGITYDPDNQYQGKLRPRYVVAFDIEGETRLWSFGIGDVPSRDRLLSAMRAYLERGDVETPFVRVAKEGNAQLIVATG